MRFVLPAYHEPDFAALGLGEAPDVTLAPAPMDGVVPEGYHATTMFPEYFRLDGRWVLPRRAAWTAWRSAGGARSPSWSSAA